MPLVAMASQQIENNINLQRKDKGKGKKQQHKSEAQKPAASKKPRPRPPPRNLGGTQQKRHKERTHARNNGDVTSSSDSEDSDEAERMPLYRGQSNNGLGRGRSNGINNDQAARGQEANGNGEDVEMLEWHESPLRLKREDIC